MPLRASKASWWPPPDLPTTASGGLARQHELVRRARANGMRVIGPESLGILNTHPAVSLNASMAPPAMPPPRGSLGLFSQSAAVGVAVYAAASRRRLGLSSFLSAGNRADVSGNDVMQYWEDDADTSAVGLYLESIGNPPQVLPLGAQIVPQQTRDRCQVRCHRPQPAARARGSHHPGAIRGSGRDDAAGRRDPG